MKEFVKHKISFCTACMNRLHHLKETLPKNIENNTDYNNLEFVILDYNSNDGLTEWAQQNMQSLIQSKRVIFYKTEEPTFFHRSHSRNMVFRLASGRILCNIDADNYTGKGFAQYVNNQFQRKQKMALSPINFHRTKKNYHPLPDTYGRVCFQKKDFLRIKGYDENMVTHGFQDYDFVNRLELAGVSRKFINELKFLTAISHADDERLSNESGYYELKNIFIQHLDHTKSRILYLYREGNFETGVIIDNKAMLSGSYTAMLTNTIKHDYSMESEKWTRGSWEQLNVSLKLKERITGIERNYQVISNQSDEDTLQLLSVKENNNYREIADTRVRRKMLLFNRQIANRNRMYKNYEQKSIVVNNHGFGKGTVYKNFDESKKIYLK